MAELDAVEFLQKQFDEQLVVVAKFRKRLYLERILRSFPAYGFKLLALIGGVAVAAGQTASVSKAIGIAIAVAVILDGVFSNHTRLMSVAAAHATMKQLLSRITHNHTMGLRRVLDVKKSDPERAAKELNDLNEKLLGELGERRLEVEQKLDTDDLKALQSLSLDEQRKSKL